VGADEVQGGLLQRSLARLRRQTAIFTEMHRKNVSVIPSTRRPENWAQDMIIDSPSRSRRHPAPPASRNMTTGLSRNVSPLLLASAYATIDETGHCVCGHAEIRMSENCRYTPHYGARIS
jgi:hypothetical protein